MNSIMARLQKDISHLQGYRNMVRSMAAEMNLGAMESAFPDAIFPLGAVHEFVCAAPEQAAASTGFMAALISSIMKKGGASIWISHKRNLFPPALKFFGIDPHRIIFIDLIREQDVLWAMEEALKCEGLAAVIGEMRNIDFTASRRLQLAVEQSNVTGFILHHTNKKAAPTTCISRWHITSLQSDTEDGLPGVGYPRWNVHLQKIRNGKPGSWKIEWQGNSFRYIPAITELRIERRKTG